jgi:AmiR/NasT family two-component response regulator
MAREAGAIHIHERPKEFAIVGNDSIKAFEALVRADERAANIACIGRIAAMVVDPIDQARLYQAMDSIRARGSA